MRKVLNRKSKLDTKWDGPFVVVASTDKDVYQLSGPNGYILSNLVNSARLRKLSSSEIERYTGEFWQASKRLKTHDQHAKDKGELQELEKKVAQATIDVLEAQKQGKPTSRDRHAQPSTQKRELQAKQAANVPVTQSASSAPFPTLNQSKKSESFTPSRNVTSRHNISTTTPPMAPVQPPRHSLRHHRLPVRFKD